MPRYDPMMGIAGRGAPSSGLRVDDDIVIDHSVGRRSRSGCRLLSGGKEEFGVALWAAERQDSEPSDNAHDYDYDDDAPPPPPPPLPESPRADGVCRLQGAAAPSFYCPLTMAMMNEPVQDREGNSYEKNAIVKWLSRNTTSPITRNRLRMKHLVPNRALKEAIDYEVKRREGTEHTKKTEGSNTPRPPLQTRPRAAISVVTPTTARRMSARHSTNDAPHHHRVINDFLSDLGVNQLDQFGMAFLPMNMLRPPPTTIIGSEEKVVNNMLMVIEAPTTRETFRLYTHFTACIEERRRRDYYSSSSSSSEEERPQAAGGGGSGSGRDGTSVSNNNNNDNRVFNDLIWHGRHKALTLARVSEERVRFSFEGKNAEIGSSGTRLRGILNMFVKVSFRMKKRIEV